MADTLVRKVILQLSADDGDTEARLDRISERADELARKHPELKVRIDTAAAAAKLGVLRAELKDVGRDIAPKIDPKVDIDPARARIEELQRQLARLRLEKQGIRIDVNATDAEVKIAELKAQVDSLGQPAGEKAGGSFGAGFGAMGYLIAAGVTAALAALPALFAGAGAVAGIAFGAALLIGTSQVKGPLYKQFHTLTSGLLGEIRTAALPLVRPLAAAFAQIGAWAAKLKPELTAIFASLGPLVAPLAKALEGMVSGLLPGFLTLMRAAKPAVSAVFGLVSMLGSSLGGLFAQLAPSVRSSSQFIAGLGGTVRSLMPVIGALANLLSGLLGPVIRTVGMTVMPVLSRAIVAVGSAISPLLPGIAGLASMILKLAVGAVVPLLPPLVRLISTVARGLAPLLPPLSRALSQVGAQISTSMTAQVVALLPPLTRLAGSLLQLATGVVIPLLQPLAKLAGAIFGVNSLGISPLMGPIEGLAGKLAGLASTVINVLIPPLQTLVGWLGNVMSAASRALGWLSHIPGLGFLGGGAGIGSGALGGLGGLGGMGLPAAAGPMLASVPSALADASAAAGFGAWASGASGTPVTTAAAGPTAAQTLAASKLGSQLTAALGSGIRETMSQATAAARTLSGEIRRALLSGKITRAEAATLTQNLESLLSQRRARMKADATAIGLDFNAALMKSLADPASASAAASAVSRLAAIVKTAWQDGLITTTRDHNLTTWLDTESDKLQSLAAKRAKIAATIAQAKSYAATVTAGAESAYSLTSAASGTSSVSQVQANLMTDVTAIKRFKTNIAKLIKLGLNKAYLAQVIGDGPVQGGILAEELASGSWAEIRSINSSESQIAKISKGLGQQAADTMYDSGKQAGKGFLSGLEAQEGRLTKMMRAMAKAMVEEIRKELGLTPGGHATAVSKASVEIHLVGGDKEFRTWLKKMIRVTGGNVSVVGA